MRSGRRIRPGVGEPNLKEKLLTSYKAGDQTYTRINLDGYDQTDLITGKGPTKRKEFYYFTETKLHGIRFGDFKFLFVKQDKWFYDFGIVGPNKGKGERANEMRAIKVG